MSPASEYPARRIFVISTLALFTAGLSFSLRAAIIGAIESEILAPLDPLHSGALAGTLLGTAFLGFATTLALGSAVLDRFGMGRMLAAAGLCFAFGTLLVIALDWQVFQPERSRDQVRESVMLLVRGMRPE